MTQTPDRAPDYCFGDMINGDFSYGKSGVRKPKAAPRASEPVKRRGVPETGHVVKLLVGQGCGFIRLANGADVFFHRSDVHDSGSINDFSIGDAVSFELLDDTVSGARAQQVRRVGPRPPV